MHRHNCAPRAAALAHPQSLRKDDPRLPRQHAVPAIDVDVNALCAGHRID